METSQRFFLAPPRGSKRLLMVWTHVSCSWLPRRGVSLSAVERDATSPLQSIAGYTRRVAACQPRMISDPRMRAADARLGSRQAALGPTYGHAASPVPGMCSSACRSPARTLHPAAHQHQSCCQKAYPAALGHGRYCWVREAVPAASKSDSLKPRHIMLTIRRGWLSVSWSALRSDPADRFSSWIQSAGTTVGRRTWRRAASS